MFNIVGYTTGEVLGSFNCYSAAVKFIQDSKLLFFRCAGESTLVVTSNVSDVRNSTV